MTLGQRIRKFRRLKDFTQAQLGERPRIDPRNLTRYENDKLKPSLKVVTRLAEAFGVAIDELVDNQEGGKATETIADREMLKLFQATEHMNAEDKAALKLVMQAMLLKSQVQGLTRTAS